MSKNKIRISRTDMESLRSFVRRRAAGGEVQNENLRRLQEALDSAAELDALPSSVAALGTPLLVKNLDSGEESVYTLVLPSQADIKENMISILAPLGLALLGRSIGDVVQFDAPGGTRKFRLEGMPAP